VAQAVANAILRWPGFRGPRTAGLTAMLTSGVTLDDRDAKIDCPEIYRKWFSLSWSDGMGGWGWSRVDGEGLGSEDRRRVREEAPQGEGL